MSNRERISANNASIQACIDKANALPDVGGEVKCKAEVEKNIEITENDEYTYTPNEGQVFSSVKVNVNVPIPDGYIQPAGTMDITKNGEYNIAKFEKVNVSVEGGGSGGGMDTDAFWEMYQGSGTRQIYMGAFCEWHNCIELGFFKPKYDIVPQGGCDYMFFKFNFTGTDHNTIDMVEELNKLGVKLDFSKNTGTHTRVFAQANVKRLGVLDFSKTSAAYNGTFLGCAFLETIDEWIINPASTFGGTVFSNCTLLKNITIGGEIGQSGLKLSNTDVLTHDSIMSVINHLKDYSGTSGTTYKVTFGSTNLAKLTDAEKAIATGKGWTLA